MIPKRQVVRRAAAAIPQIDSADWEGHEGLRETFLLYVTDPRTNETLRSLGRLLSEMTLECSTHWPQHEESLTRAELRAALAELRYLQGFLESVGGEATTCGLAAEDVALSQCAARQAVALRSIADAIQAALQPAEEGG